MFPNCASVVVVFAGVCFVRSSYAAPNLFARGSGCSAETLKVISVPDNSSISFLFDEYNAVAYAHTGRARSHCSIVLPIHVPAGVSIAVSKVEYFGNAYVPNARGNRAEFTSTYFSQGLGRSGAIKQIKFKPGYDSDFFETQTVQGSALVWSPCGTDLTFRVETHIVAQAGRTNPLQESVEIHLDGRNSFIKYYFIKRVC